MKVKLRGKLIALNASKKKLETACPNSLTAQLKALEQKDANTPKKSKQQEIIKLTAENNQGETKIAIQRITKGEADLLKKLKRQINPQLN